MKPISLEARDAKGEGAKPTWVVGGPIPPESRVGSVIEREYQVRGILSQGELGITYQVFNTRLKSYFNVLILNRELAPTHEMMLAVKADLGRARELTGLGIMPIRLITDDNGIPGFATERLDGESLRRRLSRGPLPVASALGLVLHLVKALEAAHEAKLIHGDLRPENIFLVRPMAKGPYAGRVMLLEHSLRHLRRRPPGFDDSLPVGKLMYRPPEQIAGEVLSADAGGDIFLVGAVLHECLTGKPAFYGEDVEAVLEHLSGPPALLKANTDTGLTGSLLEALNVVIAGCCSRDPQARVPLMSDVHRALSQVVSGANLVLPATVCVEPPTPAPLPAPVGRVSRILQRLSGVFPVVRQMDLTPRPAPALPGVTRAALATADPIAAPASPAPAPVQTEAPAQMVVETSAPATADIAPAPASAVLPAPSGPRPASAAPPLPTEPRPASAVPLPPSTAEAPPAPARGTLSMMIREGNLSLRRPAPVGMEGPPANRQTLHGIPVSELPLAIREAAVTAPPREAAVTAPPRELATAASLQDRVTASERPSLPGEFPLAERATWAMPQLPPLREQVRQVRERLTAGHSPISTQPLAERTTRSIRARDITELVAAVQQGKLAADQAVELARMPEEMPQAEAEREALSAAPTFDLRQSDQPTAQTAAPAPRQAMPKALSGPVGLPIAGVPVSLPIAASASAPTRRAAARPSVRASARPPQSSLRRFLLQHQELVAAVLGAGFMLFCGLLLLWCR